MTGPNIDAAVAQFITDHGDNVGLEAFQTFYNLIGHQDTCVFWNSPIGKRDRWNEVAAAVLTDFAVWYATGHYRGDQ